MNVFVATCCVLLVAVGVIVMIPNQSAKNSSSLLTGNLRTMSWNLRGSDMDNGPTTSWNVRKAVVKKVVDNIDPHIIGTQEMQPDQLHFFQKQGFAHYRSILYRAESYSVLQSSTIWFSPSGAPVRAWDASSPRGADWVLLQSVDGDKRLVFINLHLDHVGYLSRIESISILKDLIDELKASFEDVPLIITGDFNSVKYAQIWDSLMETNLQDVSLVLASQDSIEFTYHHFHGLHFNSFYMRPVQYISYAVSCTEIGRQITKIPSCFAPPIWRSIKEAIFGRGKVHHIDWMLFDKLEPQNFFVVTDHDIAPNPQLSNSWNPKEIFHRNVVKSFIYASDHFPIAASFSL
uniref:Endonuclease/exonuclease/phosphatase domain-containing protein n=1 Tax=Vannella robusta TaxID=1487602 RepID=A0A7S4I3K4_9EUKA|mmetsp:Transcript_19959/g.25208  ORF Transcript_19959/g.25208 Transcript_19959/m.25208 type:complete len:348 (+) Transcript_19959:138-1181(+)